MLNRKRKNILSQMFDVRPVDKSGDLDMEKLEKVRENWKKDQAEISQPNRIDFREKTLREIKNPNEDPEIKFQENEKQEKLLINESEPENKQDFYLRQDDLEKEFSEKYNWRDDLFEKFFTSWKKFKLRLKRKSKSFSFFSNFSPSQHCPYRLAYLPIIISFFILIILGSFSLAGKGIKIKGEVLGEGQEAYASLGEATKGITQGNFDYSLLEFNKSYQKFDGISKDINSLGKIIVSSSRFLPFVSKLSSGNHLAEAGKDISQIGILISKTLESIKEAENPLDSQKTSFLKIFQEVDKNIQEISVKLDDLEDNLEKINLEHIPEEHRQDFVALKEKIPEIKKFIDNFDRENDIFVEVLGGNGPRKYLFLFQNNHEARATGGFIGSYGVLDIFNGRIKNFYVDGIFNPDGQLQEKIIPPSPIQKISAAWSLHDSNWFPDFPKSAEKAAWFFEKTGGPTVDGVITMTPDVMKDLLEITGPIEMPEYETTISKDNFMEEVQQEVEVDYDKDLNRPKKILSDLAPKVLDKIFNVSDFRSLAQVGETLIGNLNEKNILIYSFDYDVQKTISKKGWSGEILNSSKDYLSVINTNINGYKTDGVIDQNIKHQSKINEDGTIIDTVTITRKHDGGESDLDWFNKVNADYMRLYVPEGSKLISVSGQTREFNEPPLNYEALGFKKDPQVQMEEDSIELDSETGTRIYEDSGKTVFANWVYVSPKETATIEYVYQLPFRITFDSEENIINNYALIAQKQSGSLSSQFSSEIYFPKEWEVVWKYPEEKISENKLFKINGDLEKDLYIGLAFRKSQEN